MHLNKINVTTQAFIEIADEDGPRAEQITYELRRIYGRGGFNSTIKTEHAFRKGAEIIRTTLCVTIFLNDPSERAKQLAEQRIRAACQHAEEKQYDIDFTFPGEEEEESLEDAAERQAAVGNLIEGAVDAAIADDEAAG